jgi:hypothetical protein
MVSSKGAKARPMGLSDITPPRLHLFEPETKMAVYHAGLL